MPLKQDPDLTVEICGIKFKNPVLVASGTFGYGEEYDSIFDVSQLGGIVTKSITLNPREGNPMPRCFETASGMLNAIGLTNVGVEKFISEKLPFLKAKNTRVIVNIAGFSVEEFQKVAERLNACEGIDMLEVNISCPNVKGGLEFSSTPESTYETIKKVKDSSDFPIMAKLSPNVTFIEEIAQAACEAGADCLSLINTLVGMAIDIKNQKPVLSFGTGGLSGPAIKPVALAMVWKVASKVKVPIIGIGGIMNTQDVLEFLLAGASLIQVGTANFIDPLASVKIIEGLKKYCQENQICCIKELVGKLKNR